MPCEIIPPCQVLPRETLPRKRWDVYDYKQLLMEGTLLTTGGMSSYELLDGDILVKPVPSLLHPKAEFYLLSLLAHGFGRNTVVPKMPLFIDHTGHETLLEPDFGVLFRPTAMEPEGYFLPRFVRVVIEIADGTLNFDLTTKAVLYAQAQIPYYWVYDVEQGNLLVHEEPGEIGYNRVTQYQESDTMAPVGANGTFTVSEILPRMKEQSV